VIGGNQEASAADSLVQILPFRFLTLIRKFTICRQLGLLGLSVIVNHGFVFEQKQRAAISSAQNDGLRFEAS
jgi:hypothetical protein